MTRLTAFPLALALAACLPALAVAQTLPGCPAATALESGIRIELSDGTAEIYRRAGPGRVSIEVREDGATFQRMMTAHGVHLTRFEEIQGQQPVAASLQTYDYGVPAAELPMPSAGGRWQADVEVTSPQGTRDEGQLQAYGPETTVTIAECSYAAFSVLIAYDTEDNYLEELTYLPELGFGYLVWSQSTNDELQRRSALRIAGLK